MTVIYVDTNIFLDFLLDRSNKDGVSLGSRAWNMFQKIYKGDYIMIVSTKMLEELEGELKDPSKARMLFQILHPKIKKVTYTTEELTEAERMDKKNRNDALHVILAKKYGAEYLVTRDIHFKKFPIKLKLPEDI